MIQAYQHVMESYLPKPVANHHVHKKNDIRKAYENILKLTKNSGFYKLDMSKENQAYTLGVKELATRLTDGVAELTDPWHPVYHQKFMSVSDESILEAKLVSKDVSRLPDQISITVQALAVPQANRGRDIFLPSRSLEGGTYKFMARVMDRDYELSFEMRERTSNGGALVKLTEYLQKELPGLSVSVEEPKRDYSNIYIESTVTGASEDRIFFFEAEDPKGEDLIEFFGLNQMTQASDNAHFILNGQEKQTYSNTFQIEGKLQVTLFEASDKPVALKLQNVSEQLLERTDAILGSYNELIRLASNRNASLSSSYSARKLINELRRIGEAYREELAENGLSVSNDGTLIRDAAISDEAAKDGRMQEFFTNKNGFIATLLGKAEEIAINPVEYLDKTIVTYPDSTRPRTNPYTASLYSGLFFSSYC